MKPPAMTTPPSKSHSNEGDTKEGKEEMDYDDDDEVDHFQCNAETNHKEQEPSETFENIKILMDSLEHVLSNGNDVGKPGGVTSGSKIYIAVV